MILNQIQKKLSNNFSTIGIETPELDARIILKEVLSLDDKDLILKESLDISDDTIKKINAIELRRLNGEPISKIFKKRDFYKSTFVISNDVLDPRPETELIVEIANNYINKSKVKNILDLGTGTGCILLSILKENKMINGLGIDLSKEAISIAKRNSKKLHLETQSNFLVSNWMSSVNYKYDLVVSNPPYITSGDINKLSKSVKIYDPILSLDGGDDGLNSYRLIASDLKRIISKNALIIIEIGCNQSLQVIEIFKKNDFKFIKKYNDINGLDRVLTFQ
ncbi:MAG: protein-(glutamine-N5) methyltransferase, release factor-specific [Rhodobiaceae bacterium]|nr:protein-(glutamine-N5) methyltransferase, release factor-specific [Rhodobiaceae bacterium]